MNRHLPRWRPPPRESQTQVVWCRPRTRSSRTYRPCRSAAQPILPRLCRWAVARDQTLSATSGNRTGERRASIGSGSRRPRPGQQADAAMPMAGLIRPGYRLRRPRQQIFSKPSARFPETPATPLAIVAPRSVTSGCDHCRAAACDRYPRGNNPWSGRAYATSVLLRCFARFHPTPPEYSVVVEVTRSHRRTHPTLSW